MTRSLGLRSYPAMSHNPPRVWLTDADMRRVHDDIERKQREWHSAQELADRMLARARQGRRVVLSPGTAEYLALFVKGRCGE